ncbi:hypothetical protein S83_055109, partial [Arachis hypogaea]
GFHHFPETRGLCLSEEQTVISVHRWPKMGGHRFIGMRTQHQKQTRKCEVTAILVLYGAILAHIWGIWGGQRGVKGAWPFSTRDHGWLISDCTSEGLKAALLLSKISPKIVGEPIAASLQALASFRKLYPIHRPDEISRCIKKSIAYIESIQASDGSWYGSWGVCFTYAAWFGINGLIAAGKSYSDCPAIRKACEFLLSKKLSNGGWGESYLSYQNKVYSNLENNRAHLVNTSWALLALIAARQKVHHGLLFHHVYPLYLFFLLNDHTLLLMTCRYTSKMLLAAIDEKHKGTYDFFYLPIDFKNKCNVGYAFINMMSASHIIPFYETFNGKKWEKFNSEKVASLAYARIQGKVAL